MFSRDCDSRPFDHGQFGPSKLNTELDEPTTLAAVSPAVPETLLPEDPTHAADVAVVQLAVPQSVSARLIATVTSVVAKLAPVSVVRGVPDATLYGTAEEITGADNEVVRVSSEKAPNINRESDAKVRVKLMERPSKLNTTLDVPTDVIAVSPVVPTRPLPRMPMHNTDVAVAQPVVAQTARDTTAAGEASAGASSTPVSVMLATPEPMLYGAAAVTTGAVPRGSQIKG